MQITAKAGEPAAFVEGGIIKVRRDVLVDRLLSNSALRLLGVMALNQGVTHEALARLLNRTPRSITRDMANLLERGYVLRGPAVEVGKAA